MNFLNYSLIYTLSLGMSMTICLEKQRNPPPDTGKLYKITSRREVFPYPARNWIASLWQNCYYICMKFQKKTGEA